MNENEKVNCCSSSCSGCFRFQPCIIEFGGRILLRYLARLHEAVVVRTVRRPQHDETRQHKVYYVDPYNNVEYREYRYVEPDNEVEYREYRYMEPDNDVEYRYYVEPDGDVEYYYYKD